MIETPNVERNGVTENHEANKYECGYGAKFFAQTYAECENVPKRSNDYEN